MKRKWYGADTIEWKRELGDMEHFLDTAETIGEGYGFVLFSRQHLLWLAAFVVISAVCCVLYRKGDSEKRKRWRKVVAALLLADELFKTVMLLIGGNFMMKYLPLHLCSINIFLIAIHAWKPSKLLGNFLYLICIPGAIAALLFCTWAMLPPLNFMYIHSFTIHILLALYPIMLTVGGDICPQAKYFPQCILLLAVMAVPIYGVNLLCDTNFMFLMYAEEGSPLLWFEENWGNHLFGYPVLIAAVLGVMYAPSYLLSKRRNV